MATQQKTCRNCSQIFETTEEDLKFYDKVSPVFNGKKYTIPAPTLCPDCRRQRRLITRNERKLYHRKCDFCQNQIVSIYSPDKNVKVYCPKCWFSDDWNQFEYGQVVDLNRPFFEQFEEVFRKAPRPAIHVIGNENCDFVNQCGYSKDCYLSFNTDWSQNCYYCKDVYNSKDNIDLFDCQKCELCFDSLLLTECYKVVGSMNCKNCNNVYFSANLVGCSDCFGCVNLRNKKYCFMNEQLTKEEYEKRLREINFCKNSEYKKIKADIGKFSLKFPRKYAEILQSENAFGDDLLNCKNASMSFSCVNCQDIAYCAVHSNAHDMYDCDTGGYGSELCMENISSGDHNYHCLFDANLWGNNTDAHYSHLAIGCKNIFGCASMRNQKYCILNKQYTKAEYEELVPKIIEKMQKNGEWGEFFPMNIWPYGYNETVANDYYPLEKEKVVALGLKWQDEDVSSRFQGPQSQMPDDSNDVTDEHHKMIFSCEECGKNYRIIQQEINFAKKLHLPLQKYCSNCRFKNLLKYRNPRKLWDGTCFKCSAPIQTTYAPERPEKVYCEACYLQEVY